MEHVTCMEKCKMHTKFWLGNLKEKDYLGGLGINDRLVQAIAEPSAIIVPKQWPRAGDLKHDVISCDFVAEHPFHAVKAPNEHKCKWRILNTNTVYYFTNVFE